MVANAQFDDRRAYLGFIEDAITRMASEANTLKAWLVPVVTAAYGYAIICDSWVVALVGVLATAVLAWQAANYLRQERAYRNLYEAAITAESVTFNLNTRDHLPSWCGKKSVLWSWSVLGFFGVIIIGGLVIITVTAFCWHNT